jgi:hypothetical protein
LYDAAGFASLHPIDKGAAGMSPAQGLPALAGFRDTVVELTGKGVSLDDVEAAISAQRGLTEEQKASLWLFAFSLSDRTKRQRQLQALAAIGEAGPADESYRSVPDRARPQEFDARGFPIPQRTRSFLERVARLLNSD